MALTLEGSADLDGSPGVCIAVRRGGHEPVISCGGEITVVALMNPVFSSVVQ